MTHALHIQETPNYERFELLPFNRDIRRLKNLEQSFRQHGWIAAYPCHVVENGSGKLRIKAGHHRFVVAKSLGIPIRYIVCRDDANIFELEKTTVHWSMEDYLQGHVRSGKKAYAAVREYKNRTGIPLSVCIGLLGGHTSVSNFSDKFKAGTFTISQNPLAETVADLVDTCKQVSEVATFSLFVQALARCVFVPEFDPDRFKKKISVFGSLLVHAATIDQYSKMIETIYNSHAPLKKQLHLAFLADRAARERVATRKQRG
jgi:hypothetical protein